MPAPELSNLAQTALLWEVVPNAFDGNGQAVVQAMPVELSPSANPPNGCRWIWKKSEVQAKDGSTIALDAQVTAAIPILVGSRMWLGTAVDWFGTGSGVAYPDEELMVVRTVSWTPDLKARGTLRQYGLCRLHQRGSP